MAMHRDVDTDRQIEFERSSGCGMAENHMNFIDASKDVSLMAHMSARTTNTAVKCQAVGTSNTPVTVVKCLCNYRQMPTDSRLHSH